jgi:hypothetical protein
MLSRSRTRVAMPTSISLGKPAVQNAYQWGQRLKKLFARSRLLGSYFATDRERLRDLAERRGVHHLDNLVAVPAAVT